MSTLQALLAGGLKQPIDFVAEEGKALKLRELMRADKAGEQVVMDDGALREETMRSANNQDLQKNLLKRGLLKPAQDVALHEAKMQDDSAKLAQTKAQTDETKIKGSSANLKMAMDRSDALASVFNSHLNNPSATPESLIDSLIDMRDRGIFGGGKEGQDAVIKIAQKVPNDPAQYQAFLKQRMTEYLPMKEYMKNEHDKAVLAETVKNNAATQTGNAETRAQTAKNQNDIRDISRGQLAVSQGHLAETRRVNSVTEKANAAANTPEALAASMQPKPMTIQQETKYRTQMAKDYNSVNAVLDSLDEILGSAESVKTAPGLKGATGIQSYIPSFPNSEAANAQVRLSNLEGKITQLGKAAASSSGAIGSMAVQEWKIARDMIANVDRSKGDQPLLEQISLIENQVKGAADRLREGYQAHYGKDFEAYPQFANIGTTKERKSRAKQPTSNSAPSNKPTVSNW